VIYDSLVSRELLKAASPQAELIHVGRRAGAHRSFGQDEINGLMIERARSGLMVVRLKGGDPFVFGRGGEEAEALADAGVEFEIVPGVTSAIAVPAFAGIPVTHREYGSFVTVASGHEEAGETSNDTMPWAEMARAVGRKGTLVLLMALAHIRNRMESLQTAGLGGATPAAAIQWGSTAGQKSVIGTVATLADRVQQAGLEAPAVVVVGECARLGSRLAWYQRMPLFGRRIVVTRAADQAADFIRRLRGFGADVIEFPTIKIEPPSSTVTLDRAIDDAFPYDWIIFTSARGVDAFIDRLRYRHKDLREIGNASIAAIGPATADRLRAYALNVTAMPGEYRAEAIIDAIGTARLVGARILIPRAEVAREILPTMLLQHGAREVVVAPAYRTVIPDADAGRVIELASAGAIALVTFTSSSTVKNFCGMVGEAARGLKAAAIGPITADTARDEGFDVVIEASTFTVEGLTDAVVKHFRPDECEL
jgi:uroporphyrinogen III methyltransferase/synthase